MKTGSGQLPAGRERKGVQEPSLKEETDKPERPARIEQVSETASVERAQARPGTVADRDVGPGAVDAMENFADEVRAVRELKDDAERRERACQVAAGLAEFLGVDSDSDNEP